MNQFSMQNRFGIQKNLSLLLTVLGVLLSISSATAQFGTSPWTPAAGTYTIPAGVTSITVECWGAGGGGGGARSSSGGDAAGGGGGGGAYSLITLTVVPGQSCVVAIGAGGTAGSNSGGNGGTGGTSSVTVNGTLSASAAGGTGGRGSTSTAGTGGAGGTTAASIGTTLYAGGTGGNGFIGGSYDFGGSGGGGAGSSSAGGPGHTSTGSPVATTPGGTGGATGGGNGGTGPYGLGNSGAAGSVYGGGGSGADGYNGASGSGGAGAVGKVVITYVACAAPTLYTVTGGGSYCSVGGTAPSVGLSGSTSGISYQLQLNGGNVGSPVAGTNAAISFGQQSAAGTYTVVTSGYCSTFSMTGSVAVNVFNTAPSTPGSIIGPVGVCSGSTNTFSVAAVNGAESYNWTLPGGWSGSSVTDSISATQGTGVGSISVTATNACGTSSASSSSISLNTAPATPGTISGTLSVCSGALDTFSIAAVSGATSYTWSLPGGWTGTSTTTSIIATAGSAGGTVSVTANNACGSSAAQTFIVGITPVPATPAVIFGRATECSGALDTFAVNAVSGATSYTWSLPLGWTGSSSINAILANAGSSGGTVSVTANNQCGSSAPQTFSVSITPAPATPGAISGRATVCSGALDTFSITAVSGATYYTWSLPGGWTGTSTSNSIIATAGSNGGTVSVTASNQCGTSSPQTFAVSITPAPATPGAITGRASVCSGSLDTFSIAAVSGATSYTWSLPNGWTGSSTSTSIIATAGSNGGTVSVTANNACGSSSPQTFVVSMASSPATPGAISGRASVCSGGRDTFSIAAVSGAISYTWSLPNGWTGSSTSTSIITTAGSNGGTVSVTANSACGSSSPQTFVVSIIPVPATPAAITGRAAVCSGALDTFSITAVSGATSYTWSLPNGWTGTSTTTSIIATAGSTGGTVSVTANGVCGSSAPQTFAVSITTASATPGTISSTATVCSGGRDTFSIAAVSGATSYTWSLPNGWTGTSTTTSIIATAGSTGGTVSVTANNSCGSSAPKTLAVTLNSAPATPTAIAGTSTLCSGSRDTLSIAAVSGATSYTWSLPNGWTGTSTTNSIIATSSSTGTVSVTANNTCGSSAPRTLAITVNTAPATPGAISGHSSVCSGSRDTLSVAAVTGATSYTWSLPNGWTGTSTTNSIIATSSSTGGTVSVTANNACGSSAAQTLAVTISASTPATPGQISGTLSVCSGGKDTFSIAAVTGAASYTWSLPNGWTGTSTSTSIIVTAGSTGGTISVTANNGCGRSAAQTLAVTIVSPPATPGAISGPANVCSGSRDTFSIAPVSGATSYTWTLPGGWTGTSTTPSIVATVGTVTGIITVTANKGCAVSLAQIKNDTVRTPLVSFNLAHAPICNDHNSTLTLNTGTPTGGIYSGTGVTGTSFNASGLNSGNYVLTYTYTNSYGCSAADTATIAVSPCTGVENTDASQITIYPNPFTDGITIKTDGNYGSGKVILSDLMGSEVTTQDLSAGAVNIQVNTKALASGPYLISIIADGKMIAVKKLFKID